MLPPLTVARGSSPGLKMSRRAPEGTQAVVRAIALLKTFSHDRPTLSLAELSQEHGFSRTTAHRLLAALESEELVARDPVAGTYRLGPGVIALGAQAMIDNDLRAVVQPELEALAAETGETATLEVLVGNEILILSEVKGRHLVALAAETGTTWPIHATSTGKAILAALPPERRRALVRAPLSRLTPSTITSVRALLRQVETVRERGYATVSGELEPGAAAVGAAVLDSDGAVGAISLGGPVGRLTEPRMAELGAQLRSRAAFLSRRLQTQTRRSQEV
jgi:DNA-binding IclR family transcriptional regulator